MFKFENEKIIVTVSFDPVKNINSIFFNGEIVYFKEPVTGSYLIEARPKENGSYVEGIGVYSVCYELTKEAALGQAMDYIKKTM